jgi:6,7-dimethyl-8-ribityllumazine synthase
MSHICIVVATFYEDLAEELVRGATAHIKESGSTYDTVEVPGAFEIPAAVAMAIEGGKYNGYVALGCVIRGETTHYDYVCAESARGLNDLAVECLAPIGYGILTVENEAQAKVRAAVKHGNKGRDAAEACLRMIAIKEQMAADE